MYVIIGATGHTGKAAANQLLSLNKKVRAVGRNADHLKTIVAKGAEPFIAEVTDKNAINKAFAGAEAVYLMIPPDPSSPDYFKYSNQVIEAFGHAIEKNGVKFAVVLSSVGADKNERTGPILGLHNLEQRLNEIAGLNALYLRAAYFMENTLGQADAIAQMGYAAGPLQPDLTFPMIATRDIGDFAANALLQLNFNGKKVQELHGQRDLSYAEVTAIIGKTIGKPDLKYQRLTSEQFRGALVQMGMSENAAKLLSEMTESIDSGYIKPLEPRNQGNTTPVSYETFAKENFSSQQKNRSAA